MNNDSAITDDELRKILSLDDDEELEDNEIQVCSGKWVRSDIGWWIFEEDKE